MTSAIGSLSRFLTTRASCLYALLDSAHSARIHPWMEARRIRKICLFSGISATTLAEHAPYLIPLHDQPEIIGELLARFWGKNCLLLLESTAPEEQLRIALKKCLSASLPGGVSGLFRYYDPRVFRRFLPISNGRQRQQFFSQVNRFWLENETGDGLLEMIDTISTLMQRFAGVRMLKIEEIALDKLAGHYPATNAASHRP